MRHLLLLSLWLIAGVSHGSDDVSNAVARYFDDFNRGLAASELVNAHWHPEASLYAPGGVVLFNDHQDTGNWLEALQAQIADDGWVRSEILDSSVCILGDTLALYSMKFKRVFSDGRESIGGGTYTLFKSDKWRIASLTVINPDGLMRCD